MRSTIDAQLNSMPVVLKTYAGQLHLELVSVEVDVLRSRGSDPPVLPNQQHPNPPGAENGAECKTS